MRGIVSAVDRKHFFGLRAYEFPEGRRFQNFDFGTVTEDPPHDLPETGDRKQDIDRSVLILDHSLRLVPLDLRNIPRNEA